LREQEDRDDEGDENEEANSDVGSGIGEMGGVTRDDWREEEDVEDEGDVNVVKGIGDTGEIIDGET
jgi:hypothetical protein